MLVRLLVLISSCAGLSAFAQNLQDAYGSRFQENPAAVRSAVDARGFKDVLHRWNEIAVNASGLDHTPVAPGEIRNFGEQLGPGRASRAMAIVHIAMADAVCAIRGGFTSYTGFQARSRTTSVDAAIAQAAHDTLIALYPSQMRSFDTFLGGELLGIRASQADREAGQDVGRRTAAAILEMRADDGSTTPEPRVGVDHQTSDQPGHWRQDPISQIPLALGGHWSECKPFVVESASQFRTPPLPPLTSPEYAAAYNEVKNLGGDGIHTPTQRTPEQTFIGIFWAYDGTPSLCAPPRLYNQVAVQIADQRGLTAPQLARLLALVNVSMADTAFSGWESKYYWDIWRPVTGIRESDPGTGPTGLGDGNDATVGDPSFMPLGAPASNLTGPNFTPPFPAYPSGHAAFGGTLFQALRRFFRTDNIPFIFVSDEFNGITRDNTGSIRPYLPRSYTSFSQAEEENGQSRIYLGIHWSFDKNEGIAQGRKVADYVADRIYLPIREEREPAKSRKAAPGKTTR